MKDQIKITVIATGFRAEYIHQRGAAAGAGAETHAPAAAPPAGGPEDLDVPAFLRLGGSAPAGDH